MNFVDVGTFARRSKQDNLAEFVEAKHSLRLTSLFIGSTSNRSLETAAPEPFVITFLQFMLLP